MGWLRAVHFLGRSLSSVINTIVIPVVHSSLLRLSLMRIWLARVTPV